MFHLLTAVLCALAADWPGFRGDGTGLSPEKALPLTWSPKENVAWRVDLPGYGQSSPVVWKGHVYVTAVEGEQREKGHVAAYDVKTGKLLWRHGFEPTQKARWAFSVSRAAPTPAADDAGVYAFFEGGNLLAFSHDGKPLWSRSLVRDHGEFKGGHGLGSSPAQSADSLFILVDHGGPSYLLAVDKKTGKDRWKAERKQRTSWSSPVVIAGQVVVSSNGSVAGYCLAEGKLLWEVEGLVGNTVPSATPAPGGVLVGAGVGRGDTEKAVASNSFIRLTEKAGKFTAERVWKAEKATAGFASPLAHGGHAYFVNAAGIVSCLDVNTGEERYAKRIDGPCWASPVAADGRVYLFGKNGTTTVLKPGATFEKLATNKLWDAKPAHDKKPAEKGEALDPVVYGVAAADGAFFIRTGTTLYRIGKP